MGHLKAVAVKLHDSPALYKCSDCKLYARNIESIEKHIKYHKFKNGIPSL